MADRNRRIFTLALASTLGCTAAGVLTFSPGVAVALVGAAIDVEVGPAGGPVASPDELRTPGPLDITNDYGQDLYWKFSRTNSWSGSGTLLSDGQTTNTTIYQSGYILFATNAAGPGLTNTTVTKTDPGKL